MRVWFILMRSAVYAALVSVLFVQGSLSTSLSWVVSIIIAGWCSWDQWKKHDEATPKMRLGIILETGLIVCWSVFLQEPLLLFLLISPLMRACIHLPVKDVVVLFAVELLTIAAAWLYAGGQTKLPWLQAGLLAGFGAYSFVLRLLQKERERAKRWLALSELEREQRAKDQERVRIAGQLHDVMGQSWTAVIRALDVAMVTDGEQQKHFIRSAREAAVEGLQSMRRAVHAWQDGKQSAEQWMEELQRSLHRFGEVTGVQVGLQVEEVAWARLEQPVSAAECIARSAIEAVTNAVRHGEASRVMLHINGREAGVKLIVIDEGIGFEAAENKGEGAGLASIQSHVAALGGTWSIEGHRGKGARLEVGIPYVNQGEGNGYDSDRNC